MTSKIKTYKEIDAENADFFLTVPATNYTKATAEQIEAAHEVIATIFGLNGAGGLKGTAEHRSELAKIINHLIRTRYPRLTNYKVTETRNYVNGLIYAEYNATMK